MLHKHTVFAVIVIGCALPTLVQARQVDPPIYNLVTSIAEAHGVDPALAHAVVEVESGYDCSAKSRRSTATGPMQVLRGTARAVGVSGDLRNCRTGLEAGMRYLKKMVVAAHGNECAAASAYNRGSVRGCSAYGRKVMANMRRSVRVAQL